MTHCEEFYRDWEVFLGSTWIQNKPIYESLYELSDDDDVIGSEGSANGQTELENGEGFVKISKETLLWIVIGSSIVSLGKKELTMERLNG